MPRTMLVEDTTGTPLTVRPATEAELISAINSVYSQRAARARKPQKLTPKVMADIQRKRNGGWTWTRIAKHFDVARNSIYVARRRKADSK